MKIVRSLLTLNPCYTEGRKITVKGLMLHSVGCPQPSASVFIKNWNKSTYNNACVHGFIDANDGTVYQTLPWNHRGWHGGGSSNNTHIGVEMCEPGCIKYTGGASFTCSDLTSARVAARRTYEAAVELFAMLCKEYGLDPLKDICSHREGYAKGIASNHGDPEHLWTQLGMPYTMDTFRKAVKAKLEKPQEQKVTEMRYNKISEMPSYAQPIITKLVDNRYLNGGGGAKDESGRPADLDLSLDMIRVFVVHDRAGMYDK